MVTIDTLNDQDKQDILTQWVDALNAELAKQTVPNPAAKKQCEDLALALNIKNWTYLTDFYNKAEGIKNTNPGYFIKSLRPSLDKFAPGGERIHKEYSTKAEIFDSNPLFYTHAALYFAKRDKLIINHTTGEQYNAAVLFLFKGIIDHKTIMDIANRDPDLWVELPLYIEEARKKGPRPFEFDTSKTEPLFSSLKTLDDYLNVTDVASNVYGNFGLVRIANPKASDKPWNVKDLVSANTKDIKNGLRLLAFYESLEMVIKNIDNTPISKGAIYH